MHITAGGSTVRGLVIDKFGSGLTGDGIRLDTEGGDTITGNFIGIDASGTVAAGNAQSGVNVESANDTIGGTTPAARNVISGNANPGFDDAGIVGMYINVTATVVQGNSIGTNAAGTAAVHRITPEWT